MNSRSTVRRMTLHEIDMLRGFLLQLGRKVTILKHLANLNQAVFRQGAALGPFDGLLLGLHLNDPEAGNHFLGFGKRTVGYDALAGGYPDARPPGAGVEPLGPKQHTSSRGTRLRVSAGKRVVTDGPFTEAK